MYFWDVDELVIRLKTNTLSGYEEWQQYFATMILLPVIASIDSYLHFGWSNMIGYFIRAERARDFLDPLTVLVIFMHALIYIFVGGVILIAGLIYCYNINESGDNKDFIKRMVCLTLPTGMRTLLISLGSLLLIIFLEDNHCFLESPSAAMLTITYIKIIIAVLIPIFYFWYMSKQLRKISHY